MSDNEEIVIEDVVEEVSVEPTETEVTAMDKGWKPESEWEGAEGDFVSAGEFNRRGELLGKIVAQNKKIHQLESTVGDIKDHYGRVQETEYNRALDTLKAQKVQALEDENHKGVVDTDDAIDELKRTYKEEAQEAQPAGPSTEYTDWIASNSWYNDPSLTPIADGVAQAFMRTNPGVGEQEVLDHVGREIRSLYPSRFGTTKRATPAAVEGGSATTKKPASAKYTKKDLNDTQREIMSSLVRSKVLTEAEYIKDLAKMGELG